MFVCERDTHKHTQRERAFVLRKREYTIHSPNLFNYFLSVWLWVTFSLIAVLNNILDIIKNTYMGVSLEDTS